jgi:dTDP-4-amino-4,6-dideoxygalactose transaminase
MLNTPFAPWPSFTQEEADIASRVLLSNKVNYWTGTECREFEKEFAAWAGCRHAIALSNGTVAIELALRALGIGPGDEVIVTPRSFLASASCVAMAGAKPVFADIDPDSQNLSAETIRPHLSPRTRAILCVHLAGWPCDMDPIMALAEEHGLFVIEDCAQAHGATYKGRSVGGIGHIATWSFCQDKIITTGGEGGMITTNDAKLWDKAWSYKDHGRSWDAVYNRVHPPGHGFRWLYESFGTNGRMIEMQGAIGRHQLRRLPQWHETRTRNAERICAAARRHAALRAPQVPDHSRHAWYKCYLFVRPERLRANWTRDRIMTEINEAGVPCYSGACPEMYLEKAFDGTGFRPAERLAAAKDLGETSLMFLVHPTLSDADMDKTVRVLDDVLSRASRESVSGKV